VLNDFIFADEAISGASDDRTALQRLLALAKHQPRQFDVILVDDTSRLSRKLVDALRIFEQLQFAGIRVVFVAQGIDTNSELAELLVATHGIVDSLYLKDLAKRTFRGVEQRALEGLHTGGRVFGYRHIPIEKSGMLDAHGRTVVDGVRLEVEPAQADTVRRIFERYAAGHSMKRIAIDMNTEGIQSAQPQKGRISRSWCQSSIHHILHNERYRGLVIWGKTYKLRSADTGKRIYRQKPASEWRRTELPAQRIISDKLWEAAQSRMRFVHDLYGTGAKNGIRAGRAAGSPYLFTGLLKCALCGGAVTIVSGTKRSRQDSRYGCSMHASRGSQVCGNKLLMPRRVLEAQLLVGLQMNVLRREVIDFTLRRFEEALTKIAQCKDRENARSNDVKLLAARKAKIEEGIENCTNAIAEGQPSKFLIAKLVELERELESVVACLRGARTDAIETQIRDTRKFVELRLKDLGKLLNAEPRLARAAIANHVQKIEMTPDGKSYVASGSWDLLGGGSGAVSMVPRARHAPRVGSNFRSLWRPDRAAAWIKANELLREAHAFQQVGVAGV